MTSITDPFATELPDAAKAQVDVVSNKIASIAQHVATSIAEKITTELSAYADRNRILPHEVHVNVAAFKNKDLIAIEIFRAQKGIKLIGTPVRRLKVEWGIK